MTFTSFLKKCEIACRTYYFFFVFGLKILLLFVCFQRIDEIMKRTRKSDVCPEVKVQTSDDHYMLNGKEQQNTFSVVAGLKEN